MDVAITDFTVELGTLNINNLFTEDLEITDTLKISTLVQTLETFAKFIMLIDNSCSCEVMQPGINLLKMIPHTTAHKSVREKFDKIAILLINEQQKWSEIRSPLQLQKRKQIAIKSFAPKFQQNFAPDKHYDHDRDRAQEQKLKKEYKQEFKGAVRELRKDAVYLNKIRLDKKKEADAAYKKKIDGIMGNLVQQEGAMRGYEREIKKGKRK